MAQSPSEDDRRWLLERARDPNEELEVRKDALFWAGQTGRIDADDLKGLYETLPDPELKEQVIFALAHDGSRESVTALMEIAEGEDDAGLRERAVFWLGQSDDERVPEFLLRIIRGGEGGR